MLNKFKFHGVGQGLFYSGSLFDGNFNFVYDCGSEKITLLKKCVPELPLKLDFAVISHLHEDHVNGLPDLLKQKEVKKIFLPYFDVKTYKEVFIALLIAGGILPNTETFALILQLYGVNLDLNIRSWSEYNKLQLPEIVADKDESVYRIDSERWEFRFYNREISDKTLLKLDAKVKGILGDFTIGQYLKERNDYRELKDAFEDVNKNHNLTSLILMHWDKLMPQEKTLLTGDVRFDGGLTKRIWKDIWIEDEIILQVPHHGALTEWEKVSDQIKKLSKHFVFSFGRHNSYHHPYSEVLINCGIDFAATDKIRLVYDDVPFEYETISL